jgi:hypothetical protein
MEEKSIWLSKKHCNSYIAAQGDVGESDVTCGSMIETDACGILNEVIVIEINPQILYGY